MEAAHRHTSNLTLPTVPGRVVQEWSPAAMALYLRRTSGDAAFCFARVMWDSAAWANDDWGDYWASVMELV